MSSLIEELLRGYADLRRYLARELNADDAADIAQSSFEQALTYTRQHEVQSPAGLVFSISRNLQSDAARRRRSLPQLSVEDAGIEVDQIGASDVTPEREYAGRQRLERLIQAIDGLAPRCREAFVLCKFHGLSYEEAAEEMGISATVVKKYLVQALKDCRSVLL